MSDLKLTLNSDNIYDITLDTNGDLSTIDSFDTAIIISLFTDARADSSEVPVPELRRGWWGDTVIDINDQYGCKNWLLYQERLTNNTINKLEDYSFEGLEWFVKEKLWSSIKTSVEIIKQNNKSYPKLTIIASAPNSETESYAYNLFVNTGSGRLT